MFVTGNYLITALGFVAIYAVFVAGLNLFMGYAGQVSFGQNAFAAIGGYGSAVLTTQMGWEPAAGAAGQRGRWRQRWRGWSVVVTLRLARATTWPWARSRSA